MAWLIVVLGVRCTQFNIPNGLTGPFLSWMGDLSCSVVTLFDHHIGVTLLVWMSQKSSVTPPVLKYIHDRAEFPSSSSSFPDRTTGDTSPIQHGFQSKCSEAPSKSLSVKISPA